MTEREVDQRIAKWLGQFAQRINVEAGRDTATAAAASDLADMLERDASLTEDPRCPAATLGMGTEGCMAAGGCGPEEDHTWTPACERAAPPEPMTFLHCEDCRHWTCIGTRTEEFALPQVVGLCSKYNRTRAMGSGVCDQFDNVIEEEQKRQGEEDAKATCEHSYHPSHAMGNRCVKCEAEKEAEPILGGDMWKCNNDGDHVVVTSMPDDTSNIVFFNVCHLGEKGSCSAEDFRHDYTRTGFHRH